MASPTDFAAAPTQLPPPGPRRLRRRPDDGWFGGVCAGVAEYFNVDPVIVRIAAVVLLFSGPGGPAYVVAWIFIPAAQGPVPNATPRVAIDRNDRGTQAFGVVLLIIAISVFFEGEWWRNWLLPSALIGLGAWLLLRRADDDATKPPAAPPPAPTPSPTAWAWGAAPGDARAPEVIDAADIEGSADDTTALAAAGDVELDDGTPPPPPAPPWEALSQPQPPPGPPMPIAPGRRWALGSSVFGAVLVWAAVAFLADVTVETGLAGGLLIIGIGFVLGAFVGGSRGLILPALIIAAALALTAAVDIPLSGPVGQQRWTPQRLADVEDEYEVSMGEGVLDLGAVDIRAGERVSVDVRIGLGHLVVLVPDGMAVDVTTDVGAGESAVLDLRQSGVGFTTDQHASGDPTSGTLVLDLQVGMGQIEVRRTADGTTSTTRELG